MVLSSNFKQTTRPNVERNQKPARISKNANHKKQIEDGAFLSVSLLLVTLFYEWKCHAAKPSKVKWRPEKKKQLWEDLRWKALLLHGISRHPAFPNLASAIHKFRSQSPRIPIGISCGLERGAAHVPLLGQKVILAGTSPSPLPKSLLHSWNRCRPALPLKEPRAQQSMFASVGRVFVR